MFCRISFILLQCTKISKRQKSDSQPIVLDEELIESNHLKCSYPKVNPLISSKENLKCRNVKAVLKYHQPSPNRDIEEFSHHMLFSFYPFRIEQYLKFSPITGTYFKKRQEPGVLHITNRNRAIMEPFSDEVDKALLSLQSNFNAFAKQDENQEEIALIVNDLLDNENPSDGALLLEGTPFIGSYSTPTLIPLLKKCLSIMNNTNDLFKAGRNVMLKANHFLC